MVALSGFTVYITYGLESNQSFSQIANQEDLGYSNAIHCNYIQSLYIDVVNNKNLQFFFSKNSFPFLSGHDILTGTGFTANKIYAIIQYIDRSKYSNEKDIKPISTEWRKYDVTDQIVGYVTNATITSDDIVNTTFNVDINKYKIMPIYDISYLNYPNVLNSDNKLSFGEEQIFFGNVSTKIQAIAYSSDMIITLPLNNFNTTTNSTWDNVSPVQISEIGIYDDIGNLVAIGKLNNPISKDNTISRSFVFGIDF